MSEPTEPTYVLVPGAWHGPWAWGPVARRLREAGRQVVTFPLPGLDYDESPAGWHLSDAVDRIVDEVQRRDLSEVVLVGHSWAGYPITGAAHRLADRLRRVVYYNACVPSPGRSLCDENPEYTQGMREMAAASPTGSVGIVVDVISQTLMPDQPEPVTELFFELLLEQPGAYFTEALEHGEPVTSAGIEVAYILSDDERALVVPGREFAARVGVTDPIIVPGDHESLLTRPEPLARALLALA